MLGASNDWNPGKWAAWDQSFDYEMPPAPPPAPPTLPPIVKYNDPREMLVGKAGLPWWLWLIAAVVVFRRKW